jgi:hypothetical protein
MGILDDAIREHLELKRRHGVPEDEVQRQEEEALGPARREVAQQPEEAELAAGQTATAEAERDEPGSAEEEPAPFDMEHADEEAGEASLDQPPAGMEPLAEAPPVEEPPVEEPPVEEPLAEAPPVEEPPVEEPPVEEPPVEEPPVEAPPPEPPPVEPTPEEPTPAEVPPAAPVRDEEPLAQSDDDLGDTEPHGFTALDDDAEDEPLEEDVLVSDPEDEDLDVLEDTPDFLQETPEHDRLWFEQKPPRDFDFD